MPFSPTRQVLTVPIFLCQVRAVKKGTDYLLASPAQAWSEYKAFKKSMRTPLNDKIFERSINYRSRDLVNVERDWNTDTGY